MMMTSNDGYAEYANSTRVRARYSASSSGGAPRARTPPRGGSTRQPQDPETGVVDRESLALQTDRLMIRFASLRQTARNCLWISCGIDRPSLLVQHTNHARRHARDDCGVCCARCWDARSPLHGHTIPVGLSACPERLPDGRARTNETTMTRMRFGASWLVAAFSRGQAFPAESRGCRVHTHL